MTDKEMQDQEVELHDEVENEVVEANTHDPKNAEDQANASVKSAAAGGPKATAPGGPGGKAEPMPKTKAGMINAMFTKMNGMSKAEMAKMYDSYMNKEMSHMKDMKKEDVDADAETEILYQADFKDDLNALVAEEATLSDEFKTKAETIFEAAIKSKLSAEIDRLEEKYDEELSSEIEATKADLVEKVDSYLNYVVEGWMEENKVAVQAGLRTEIAEKFMNNLKDLFTESYIEVPESKVDLVDELAAEVEELEEKFNEATGRAIEMQEELEVLKRSAIIREASVGLAETQIEKLESLVADVDFESEEQFTNKVNTVKESYFNKPAAATEETVDEDDTFQVEASDAMSSYLSAIKKTSK